MTEEETRVALELQRMCGQPSFENLLRTALDRLTRFHGLRVPARVWQQR